MRLYSYLRSAESILLQYDGAVPFASWLKNYFKQNKKFGSKDRKAISDLCFCFFRLGIAFPDYSVEERLIIGQFLCHNESSFIYELRPEWVAFLDAAASEKLKVLEQEGEIQVFPFDDDLSSGIERQLFHLAHLVQPDLFLRSRPGRKEAVIKKLQNASVQFVADDDCIQLANTTKIDELIELDKEAVVQDKSSQLVLEPLKNIWEKELFTSWDCCAASGGKTILLHDLFPMAQLTVSDIRESILHNLRSRFRRAGIQQYNSFVADVSANSFRSTKKYDVIICDAPCSGSGTWGRTPEQLAFFKKEKIDYYSNLQKRIAINASNSLKQEGAFVYITCSVFKKENEEVADYILQNTSLKLKSQQYVKGYNEKADTLFTALFTL